MKSASQWIVLKFGGTSVATADCWNTISSVVKKRQEKNFRPLVVCSAIAGISDQLEFLLEESVLGRHEAVIESIKKRHIKLSQELGVSFDEIEQYVQELTRLALGASLTREVSPRLRAQTLALGELMSTRLGAAFLKNSGLNVAWYDARDCLSAKDLGINQQRRFLSNRCDYDSDPILKKLFAAERASVILTQGFIARNGDGDTVLLGRGGSDVSAAYFAAKLDAVRLEIWTDVPGMYTANPRKVPQARLLKKLDYDEAQEIASSGAKVLHPRCIAPARKHQIPIHIYSMDHANLEGTVISTDVYKGGSLLRAISSRSGVVLVSLDSVEMWQQPGFLADVFSHFKRHGLSIDLISTSETNVTVSLDRGVNVLNQESINALKDDLSKICEVKLIDGCAFVSLVGKNIRAILHKLGPALELFEEQKIYLVSQAANDLNFTFVVDEEQAPRLVEKLHDQLFGKQSHNELFGSTWRELNISQKEKELITIPWWQKKKENLISLARKEAPIYVYDEETIDHLIGELRTLTAIDNTLYAIKANVNPEILKIFYDAGLGFECVSVCEVEHVIKLFPQIDRKRILFTPNFTPPAEYEQAFDHGVIVTLDNLYPLEVWKDLFKKREIFLRIDPGKGLGHHKYVHTGGTKSKFGISVSQLDQVLSLLNKCDAHVKGLHAHVGSNIFETDTWSNVALFLAEVAKSFSEVEVLDVGGGLGVVERPGQWPLDLNAVNQMLTDAKKIHPDYKLWIEPGRFLVAEAGVLLTRMTQTKQKGEYRYVGVDAGMNTLIRPALYGSYHDIVNLSRTDDNTSRPVNIVGPICESGDVLGYERSIAEPRDGDILLIATVGAYGRVMSSNYNMRNPAKEYFLRKNELVL